MRLFSKTKGGVVIAFIVLFILLSILSPYFLSTTNIINVIRQSVFISIIAFSMTFVISMGGIDLSVGGTLAMVGVITACLLKAGVGVFYVVLIGLLLGALIGAINGFLIAILGVTDFIATLAMMTMLRGIIMNITHGVPIFGLRSPSFQYLCQGYIFGAVPTPIIIMIITFIISYYLMYKTKFGRYTISIGSNFEAARLVGINIKKIKILVYTLSGLFSGISGVLLTSRLEAAMPEAGLGYELEVIAATIIGGTGLAGGEGYLLGTALGAVLMVLIRNGLNLLNVSTFWHQVVIGGIILIAVGINKIKFTKNGRNG